jgi:hypothetical protein
MPVMALSRAQASCPWEDPLQVLPLALQHWTI